MSTVFQAIFYAVYLNRLIPKVSILGGIIEGECFSPEQIKKWTELKFVKEMGEILGLLDQAPRQLTSTLATVLHLLDPFYDLILGPVSILLLEQIELECIAK